MDSLVKSWKDADWESILARVDGEIKAISDRQDAAEEGKKLLLGESKQYRENTDKEQRRVAVPLIKGFQKEVDQLTLRGKATEASLIEICGRITSLPDPTAVLNQCAVWRSRAEKADRAEEEARELRQNIQDLHKEFSNLQNQDVTIRELRDRIKQLETEKTEEVELSSVETEKILREEFALREQDMSLLSEKMKQENGLLEKKVSELEARMKDAQRRLDMARLEKNQKEALESEQIDILKNDLRDANRRISSFEVEVARLTADLAESKANPPRSGLEDIAALGGLMKEKDEQIARLTEENRKLMERLESQSKKSVDKMEGMTRELERYALIVESLNSELGKRADYEQIKQELSVLRQMEFGSSGSDGMDVSSSLEGTLKTLDQLLVDKNKKLQGDNAQLRTQHEQMAVTENLTQQLLSGKAPVIDVIAKPSQNVQQQKQQQQPQQQQQELQQQQPETSSKKKEEPEADQQTLFNILLNSMGGGPSSSSATTPSAKVAAPSLSRMDSTISESDSGEDKAYDECTLQMDEVGPRISNYTGEQPKSPTEIKAISELTKLVASNVRMLGAKALNTSEVARQCKRLMVAYNIGQRLFAKYVMNQVVKSQGSLSELLSKPRHWSKLTDKGREAFRRIYAWISDEKAIQLLCVLSPRRVCAGDMKIEHPKPETLWECNSGQTPAVELPDENYYHRRAATAKEDQYRSAGTSSASRGSSRWRHDDIPKEKIISIFQNELSKLREQLSQESNLERAINSRTAGISPNGSTSLKRLEDLAYGGVTTQGLPSAHAQAVMNMRMKTGLLPITNEQFEEFGVINTEDVVRQIKDFLTVNTISQRQFGEHVLGLSQGSVSDLLARPKQWTMLTQKGREPFIRMKLFMQDVVTAAAGTKPKEHSNEPRTESTSMDRSDSGSPLPGGGTSATATVEAINTGEDVEILFLPVIKSEIDEDSCISDDPAAAVMADLSSLFSARPVDDRDWEEADIDTDVLVRKVKDRLHSHGISQRHFGEVILGCSAGGCSELFLRPRKWHSMSKKGKEPYEKMISWLNDRNGIAKLQAHDKSYDDDYKPPSGIGSKRISEDDSAYDSAPRKMQRTVITDAQKEALKFVFAHEPHPNQRTCEQLANKLCLHIRTVNNWFHNYRTRQKASLKEGKLHPSQLPVVDKTRDWRKDLATMLDEHESRADNMSGSPNRKGTDSDGSSSNSSTIIDKAVERLRMLSDVTKMT